MKKIECLVSDSKMKLINEICEDNGFTYAEFNRRAIEALLSSLKSGEELFYLPTQANIQKVKK